MSDGDPREGDEQLEQLWYFRERGEAATVGRLSAEAGTPGRAAELQRLAAEAYVELGADGRIRLTARGEERAALLVRSHRLAERLVHDVLGKEYEQGACEFEHVLNPTVVDAICTLLGHPRECPHGMPIPPGACCRARAETVPSSVIPLTRLALGQSARVAYVHGETDRQLHKLENLQVRPGVLVRLHQSSPSFVIECEGATIALDERVAAAIHVWAPREVPAGDQPAGHGRRERGRHRRGHGQATGPFPRTSPG